MTRIHREDDGRDGTREMSRHEEREMKSIIHLSRQMFEEEEDKNDDDDFKLREINKSFESENDPETNNNKTTVDVNEKETIGMRTRSKFSLNDTPLEIIAQAFIPPDITEDMYDSACENDEWIEFLSELTKPLEFNNSLLNINEHLEKRSCILPLPTIKENSQLGIEQHNTNEDISVITNIVPQFVNISQVNIMTQKQIILFKQQLTQHVQLITQNYLLSSMSKKYQNNCRKFKAMLVQIKEFCKDKKYVPINIHPSLKFIRDWTEVVTREKDINNDYIVLPLHVKEFMLYYDKPVFIYPQLLPTRTYHHEIVNHPIGPSEKKLLVLKIDYIYKKLKESANTRAKYKNHNLSNLLPMILKTVHRRWFSNRTIRYLRHLITRQKNSFEMNVIKNYLIHGKIEESSYVIDIKALFSKKRLYECDVRKFPSSWKSIRNQLKLRK